MIALTPHDFGLYGGETVSPTENPGISDLDVQELKALDRVIAEYGHLSSKELSDRSHRESLWMSRNDGDTLPYSDAPSARMIQALVS